ncbi:hypothetical protein BDF14DRAFT_1848912 [Spinellus fusiger]|nr:hypothetical protein BDF14DRAFT_1848912 [Spinellus fusiger]
MADAYTYAPIIRLPKSKSTLHRPHQQDLTSHSHRVEELFTDTLYFEGLTHAVSENDIRSLLEQYQPVDIHITHEEGSGYLRLSDSRLADRIYSLYNGFTFSDGSKLQFHLHGDRHYDPEPQGAILQVKGLGLQVDNHELYNLFRPFGPLFLCKPIVDSVGFRGTAFIQYFFEEDSENAQQHLHGKQLYGSHVLSVVSFLSKSNAPSKAVPHTSTSEKTEASHVDYLNLYIKNLDPMITSDNLRELFGRFGRIVSARVMSNPTTHQSKGYGFVSYGRSEEASAALQEMHNTMVGSKPLIVSYHEPKRPRQEKSIVGSTSPNPMHFGSNPMAVQNEYGFGPVSHPSDPMYCPPENRHPHDMMMMMHPSMHAPPPPSPAGTSGVGTGTGTTGGSTGAVSGLGIDNVDQLAMSIKDLSVGRHQPIPHPIQRKTSVADVHYASSNPNTTPMSTSYPSTLRLSPQFPSPPISGTSTGPSLASLASGLSVQQPPFSHDYKKPQGNTNGGGRPTLRRKGSIESICSVMTESTADVKYQRMSEAVSQCGQFGKNLPEIVDMLLTLKRKERSLCLFNQDFLREKIHLALEALEAFSEDQDDGEDDMTLTSTKYSEPSDTTAFLSPERTLSSTATTATSTHTHTHTILSSSRALSSPSPTTPSPTSLPLPETKSNGVVSAQHTVSPRMMKHYGTDRSDPKQHSHEKDIHQAAIVASLLESLSGKSSHEKKQLLGDRLFPLVKATGAKHAPKITIRLLDTIEIPELAQLMYNKTVLKERVDIAAASLKQAC